MKRRAFTLVELLVVIAIIGLLSTVAVVAFGSARSRSRDTKRMADIKGIIQAMDIYKLDHNDQYPDPSGALGCACGSLATGACCLGHGDAGTCWNGTAHGCTALDNDLAPYMAKIPDDPENAANSYGDAYVYLDASVTGGWVTPGPALHWGYDQAANSTNCFGGVFGNWGTGPGGPGRDRYWCALTLK